MSEQQERQRAPRGAGSIFQIERRGERVWIAQQTVRVDGRRHYISGHGRTQSEAIQHRAERYEHFLRFGLSRAPRMTLTRAIRQWEADAREQKRSDEYIRGTRRAIEIHAIPIIGDRPLSEYSRRIMSDMFQRIGTGSELTTGRRVHKALTAIFHFAVQRGWIQTSPMTGIRQPSYEAGVRDDDEKFSEERWKMYLRFLAWLKQRGDDFYTPALFLSLGLRRGELAGIERSSVSMTDGSPWVLTIDRRYLIGPPRIEHGTKNGKARRIVLPETYQKALETWTWNHVRTMVPEPWAKDQIFIRRSRTDGKYHGRSGDGVWEDWRRLLKEFSREEWYRENPPMDDSDEMRRAQDDIFEQAFQNSMYFRPHFVRHLTATSLAEAGVSLHDAQALLGHMDDEMTAHYTHTMSRSEAHGAAIMSGQVFEGGE